jgi:hypothetical protein
MGNNNHFNNNQASNMSIREKSQIWCNIESGEININDLSEGFYESLCQNSINR